MSLSSEENTGIDDTPSGIPAAVAIGTVQKSEVVSQTEQENSPGIRQIWADSIHLQMTASTTDLDEDLEYDYETESDSEPGAHCELYLQNIHIKS